MRNFIRGVLISLGIAGVILAAFLFLTSIANANEHPPDLFVTFGCFQEQTTLDLAHVWVEKGDYYFDEAANEYLQLDECFVLYQPGWAAYIDRVVKRLSKDYNNMPSYVVEAHMYSSPAVGEEGYMPFYFLYHGDLPERAVRREAL